MKEISRKLFGIELYKKKVEIYPLENSEAFDFDVKYPGLSFLALAQDLKYSSFSFIENYDWSKLARESIFLTIYVLFRTKAISVSKKVTTKSFFNGIVTYDSFHFIIAKTDNESHDLLSQDLFTLLKGYITESENYCSIGELIHLLISYKIGKEERNTPEKIFITKILTQYSKAFNWLTLARSKKNFNLISKYELQIEETHQEQILKAYKYIIKDLKKKYNSEKAFEELVKEATNLIKKEFELRYSSADD